MLQIFHVARIEAELSLNMQNMYSPWVFIWSTCHHVVGLDVWFCCPCDRTFLHECCLLTLYMMYWLYTDHVGGLLAELSSDAFTVLCTHKVVGIYKSPPLMHSLCTPSVAILIAEISSDLLSLCTHKDLRHNSPVMYMLVTHLIIGLK